MHFRLNMPKAFKTINQAIQLNAAKQKSFHLPIKLFQTPANFNVFTCIIFATVLEHVYKTFTAYEMRTTCDAYISIVYMYYNNI